MKAEDAVADATASLREPSTRWAVGLPVLRVVLVAAASALTWVIISIVESGVTFPAPPMIAVVTMLPVNIVCLLLVVRLLRGEGRSIRDLLGFERRRVLKDFLWGLLWLGVLYIPFSGAIMLVAWVQHGAEMFVRMETMFVDPSAIPTLTPLAWSVLGIVGALTFAPVNAPVEEMIYRGYAQGNLARRWPAVLAIVVPSILFALQHVWYAPTPDAIVSFVCAFFVWGIGSGLIYQRQRRLMPLVFAHGLVNLFFTLPALAMPFFLSTTGA